MYLPSHDTFVQERVERLQSLLEKDDRFGWKETPTGGEVYIRHDTRSRAMPVGDKRDAVVSLVEAETLPQYVWPAAYSLISWLIANKELFEGKSILELGCGTGVVGYALSSLASRMVLTDCSPVSLALAELTRRNRPYTNCVVGQLKWGDLDQLQELLDFVQLDRFDVVIGSDIFYFNQTLRLGLNTARHALKHQGTFICGSVARSERMECDLQSIPSEYGFVLDDFVDEEPFQLYRWSISGSSERLVKE
ncbi:Putative methyltransferase family protein [Strigomonas culicis]|uniref:Putative methyltransferase family protein n=1 Tax=Strigomonas culicis TaxID=28005 RepID=S9WK94_9TRYP|nr:Putative methyltransferase family protein [Strigomonas culicis]|eukprot:EPY36385.1 Putative methyltransferase family protein [Strigomonas culicis]